MSLLKILIVCLFIRALSAAPTKGPPPEETDGKLATVEDEGRQQDRTRKAHFRQVGRMVPYTKFIEVRLVLNVSDSLEAARNASGELERKVGLFIAKHGKKSKESESLSLLLRRGGEKVSHAMEELTSFLRKTAKRGIAELLGMALSFFQGWANRDAITNLETNEDILHKDVTLNRGYVQKAVNAVQELKDGMVGGLEYQELVTEIMGVQDHLYAGVEDLLDAAYEAAQGKLHRLVAPPTTLEEAMKEVKASAGKQQLQAVFSHGAELLSSPRSVVLGTDGIVAVLHVPVHDEISGIMKLYHLERAEVVHDRALERLVVPRPFFGEDRTGWRVTTTAEDLSLCNKQGDLYLCSHDRQLRRGVFDCTSALFSQSAEGEWCESRVTRHARSHLVDLGDGWYHGRVTAAKITCSNGASKEVDWTEVATRRVDPGCQLSAQDVVVLKGHEQPLRQGETKVFVSPRDPGYFNELPGLTGEGAKAVEKVVTRLEIMPTQDLLKSRWGMKVMFYILIAMGVVMGILVLAVVVMVRYLWANKARVAGQLEAAMANASLTSSSGNSSLPAGSNISRIDPSNDSGLSSGSGISAKQELEERLQERMAELTKASTKVQMLKSGARARTSSLDTSRTEEYVKGQLASSGSMVRKNRSRRKSSQYTPVWQRV